MNKSTRVLIAEDDLWLPETSFVKAFKKAGLEIDFAYDEAGLRAQAPGADVLVIDAMLDPPKFDGVDATVDMVTSGDIRPDVPIMFISMTPEAEAMRKTRLHVLREMNRYTWHDKLFDLDFLILQIRKEMKRCKAEQIRS